MPGTFKLENGRESVENICGVRGMGRSWSFITSVGYQASQTTRRCSCSSEVGSDDVKGQRARISSTIGGHQKHLKNSLKYLGIRPPHEISPTCSDAYMPNINVVSLVLLRLYSSSWLSLIVL